LENPDDDAYESAGYETSSASLTSSVNEYVFENGAKLLVVTAVANLTRTHVGRRYHAYFGVDKNLMPTDEVLQKPL
jgi:hypothetical protein